LHDDPRHTRRLAAAAVVTSATDGLLARLRELPDVEERQSQFADMPALWIDGREFVHIQADQVEIRLTRKLISQLDEPGAAQRARTSDWVIVDAAEEALALELARRALDANRRDGTH
jgi:hypothetical protein